MKTWKKFAALVLTLGLTAGFVACGGGNDGNNSGSSNACIHGRAALPEQTRTLFVMILYIRCKEVYLTITSVAP